MRYLIIFGLLISNICFSQVLQDPSSQPSTSRTNDAISTAYPSTGTDAYSISPLGSYSYTYLIGKAVSVTFGNTNTGASTLNFDGLGVKDIKKWSGGSLANVASGDLIGTIRLRYDGTRFVMEGGAGSGGGSGTVTNVAALTLGTTGTDLSSSVSNPTTTPVITLNVPTASGSNRGALSSTDWTSFNGKQSAITFGTGVQTALGVNVGTTGSPVINGGVLGTPSSGTLTNATGLPLATGVTGELPYANFTNGVGLSVAGRSANTTGVQGDIVAGTDAHVLRRSGTTLGFGTIGDASISGLDYGKLTGTVPFYSLSTGGTATSANTFTYNTANFLNYTGTYTATAIGQRWADYSPIITMRGTASDTHSAIHIGGSTEAKANSQVMAGLLIDHTFGNTGSFTSLTQDHLRIVQTNPLFRVNAGGISIGNNSNTNSISVTTSGADLGITGAGGNDIRLFHSGGILIGTTSNSLLYIRNGDTFGVDTQISGTVATSTATQRNSFVGNYTTSLWTGAAAQPGFFTTRATSSTSVDLEMYYDIFTGTSTSTPSLSTLLFRLKQNGALLLGAPSTATTPTANTRLDVRGIGTGTNLTQRWATSGNTQKIAFLDNGQIDIDKTITAGGTTGAQTIDKVHGSVNFAAAAATLVVTNALVTTSSNVFVQVYGTDVTAKTARVTLAAGSFTITLDAAATAETKVGFFVLN